MELPALTKTLDECLKYGDKACFEKNVQKLLNKVSEERATELLASYLYNRYTTFKADSIAGLMEIVIRKNLNLGLVNFPDNNLFRAAILRGSVDLFDCYIEEFAQPYLKKDKKVDAIGFYVELIAVVEFYIEKQAEQELPVIKGVHFNGAFSPSEEVPSAVLVNSEDYEVMNSTVEKYNALVGRKEILKKLGQILDEV